MASLCCDVANNLPDNDNDSKEVSYLNFDVIGNPPMNKKYIDYFQKECIKLGNPNSIHKLGQISKLEIDEALEKIKSIFKNKFDYVEFIPGGGSCSNKRSIVGSINTTPKINKATGIKRDVVLISQTEHQSINTYVTNILNKYGYYVIMLPVLFNGLINFDVLESVLKEYQMRIALISIIYVNNETGKIQPLNELVELVKSMDPEILIHSDITHGLHNFNSYLGLNNQIDIVSFSCYKFGGPHMGIVLSKHILSEDYYGTPDVISICSSVMCLEDHFIDIIEKQIILKEIKTQLTFKLRSLFDKYNILYANVSSENCVDNVLTFLLKMYQGKTIQKMLSDENILIGTGSACMANKDIGSYVLHAYGYSSKDTFGLIRLSYSFQDLNKIDYFVEQLDIVLSKIAHLVPAIDTHIVVKFKTNPRTIVVKYPVSLKKSSYPYDINLPLLDEPQYNFVKCSLAESYLKGANKKIFVEHLVKDIKQRFEKTKSGKVVGNEHSIFIKDYDNEDIDFLNKVPGLACYSKTYKIKKDINLIYQYIATIYNNNLGKTFRIETKLKAQSKFESYSCQELNNVFGQYIIDKFPNTAKVNLDNPQLIIYIVIEHDLVVIYTDKILSLGGLPLKSTGEVDYIIDSNNLRQSLNGIYGMSIRGCLVNCHLTKEISLNPLFQQFINLIKSFNPYTTFNIIESISSSGSIDLSLIETKSRMIGYEAPNNTDLVKWSVGLKAQGKKIKKLLFANNGTNIWSTALPEHIYNEFMQFGSLYDLSYNQFGNLEYTLDKQPSADFALSLISGGIDSPVASYLVKTQGIQLEYIHYTTDINKTDEIKKMIEKICRKTNNSINAYKAKLYLVSFKDLQDEIFKKCESSYRTIMYKIFMLKIAEIVANSAGIRAVVTGNSLGQVASQTFENLVICDQFIELPIISPLLAVNKISIINLAEKIDTFTNSICGGTNDCCVLYLPKHPVLKASYSVIKQYVSELDNFMDFVKITVLEIVV